MFFMNNYYYCKYVGLPQEEKMKLENIHFLCCSNRVSTLELAEPLVDDLLELEEGIPMFDASVQDNVLVVASVMLLICDNPMSSDLCNHQGSSARKFCRMCMVSMHGANYCTVIIIVVRMFISCTG